MASVSKEYEVGILFEAVDPQGVRVALHEGTWTAKICRARPYLGGHEQAVKNTIEQPMLLVTGNDAATDRVAYRLGAVQQPPYDRCYLAVVYRRKSEDAAVVVTAYCCSRTKREGTVLHVSSG